MKEDNNFLKIVIIVAGVVYVYKLKKSAGTLGSFGIFPSALVSLAMPFLGIDNTFLRMAVSQGAKAFFSGEDSDVIDAEYRRIK